MEGTIQSRVQRMLMAMPVHMKGPKSELMMTLNLQHPGEFVAYLPDGTVIAHSPLHEELQQELSTTTVDFDASALKIAKF